jgi:hypothetical protein
LVILIEMSHYHIAFKDEKETGRINMGLALITL